MNQPKVSVIIPVYNVEEYIGLTLDSLLNQTLKDIEIIVIDDGSTDNSRQIIEDYEKKYKNIRVILQENSGPSRARNRGVEEATGEYLAFVDSDDLLPENSLELRYHAAVEQDADLIIGGTYRFNSQRKWPLTRHFLGYGEKNIRKDESILFTIGPCNKLYKTSLAKTLHFPEHIRFAEDQVFVIGAYTSAKKIYSINDVVYYYREREDEKNRSLTQQVHHKSAYIVKEVCKSWNLISKTIDQNISEQVFNCLIKANHLNRLAMFELGPAFRAGIMSKDKEIQKSILEDVITLVENLDIEVLNRQKKLKWILSKNIILKYLFIEKSNRPLASTLVSKLFNLNRRETTCSQALDTQSNRGLVRRLKSKTSRLVKALHQRIIKFYSSCVFKISKCLPVKKNLVILATNRSSELEGNLKAVSDELHQQSLLQTLIYLKQDKLSISQLTKMYYHFARAKYIILDDYYRQLYGYRFKKETEIIQVWHACGAFKKFGFSAIGQGECNPLSFEKRAHQHYTKVITSAKEINKYYAEAFNISEDKVLNLGVPRTDKILDADYRKFTRLKLEKDYPQIKGKKVITYAPTFRGSPKVRKHFKCELDYTRLIDELGEDYVLILKLHPVVNKECVQIPADYRDKIINLTHYKEMNDVLIITDLLITDYSSVIFEYGLLERPMLLFAYDLEDYLDERNFYYDFENLVPGPIVHTNDELIQMIKNNQFDMTKIKLFKKKFFDEVDGKSTKRLVKYLIENKD